MDAHLVDLAASRWLPVLVDGALRATVVLAAAAGLTRLLRHAGAATRHLVWSTAVAGVLALPLLTLAAPRWDVPVATSRFPIARLTPPPAALPTVPSMPLVQPAPSASAPSIDAPLPIAAPASPSKPSLAPTTWIAIVWTVGALAVLLRLALGTLGLAHLVNRARPADDPSWVMLLQRLARELGIRRPVTLLVGRTGTVPVTWGVVYPVVLLPADADAWSDERRRAVLLHELAHVERFDAFTHTLSQLALALFWFHPLVWTASRRLRAERERACDDLVLAVGTRATTYADDLLELVQTLGEASPAAAALAMARRSEFEGRLLAILDPAVPRARTTRRAAAVALTVAAVALVPLAAARPVAHQPPAATAGVAAPPSARPNDTVILARRLAAPVSRLAAGVAALDAGRQRLAERLETMAQAQQCAPRAGIHVSRNDDGARMESRFADRDKCIDVVARGKIEYTADDSDVARLATGGSLAVAETRDGTTREATLRERDGRIERAFAVNGRAADAAEGAAWLRTIVPMLARESADGIPARVARIRRQRGVAGVLEEINRIASDGVKHAWFDALLDGDRLTGEELRQAALTARTIASDGDKSAVLRRVSEAGGDDVSVAMAVVATANTLASDGDRRRVLTRVASTRAPSIAVLTTAARSASAMASDGDKATVLRSILARAGDATSVRAAVIEAASTIASDGDRASVLIAALGPPTDEGTLVAALRASRAIASDGDRSRVLLSALPHASFAADRVRAAFFESVVGMASDSDKARVLIEVASRPGALDVPATRTAFFATLRTLSSDGDYRRVMAAVTR